MRWAYIREIWDFGSTMEIEEKHTGRYGARGQEREEKKKATPEEIAKQNQWGRYQKAEQVETRAGPEKTDQVEFLSRRLLDDSHIQEGGTPRVGTDEERSCEADQKSPTEI